MSRFKIKHNLDSNKDFSRLLVSKREPCDFIIHCDGEDVFFHRQVLSCFSTFFTNFTENNYAYRVEGAELDDVLAIKNYVYNGQCVIQRGQLERLYEITRDLEFNSMCSQIEERLIKASETGTHALKKVKKKRPRCSTNQEIVGPDPVIDERNAKKSRNSVTICTTNGVPGVNPSDEDGHEPSTSEESRFNIDVLLDDDRSTGCRIEPLAFESAHDENDVKDVQMLSQSATCEATEEDETLTILKVWKEEFEKNPTANICEKTIMSRMQAAGIHKPFSAIRYKLERVLLQYCLNINTDAMTPFLPLLSSIKCVGASSSDQLAITYEEPEILAITNNEESMPVAPLPVAALPVTSLPTNPVVEQSAIWIANVPWSLDETEKFLQFWSSCDNVGETFVNIDEKFKAIGIVKGVINIHKYWKELTHFYESDGIQKDQFPTSFLDLFHKYKLVNNRLTLVDKKNCFAKSNKSELDESPVSPIVKAIEPTDGSLTLETVLKMHDEEDDSSEEDEVIVLEEIVPNQSEINQPKAIENSASTTVPLENQEKEVLTLSTKVPCIEADRIFLELWAALSVDDKNVKVPKLLKALKDAGIQCVYMDVWQKMNWFTEMYKKHDESLSPYSEILPRIAFPEIGCPAEENSCDILVIDNHVNNDHPKPQDDDSHSPDSISTADLEVTEAKVSYPENVDSITKPNPEDEFNTNTSALLLEQINSSTNVSHKSPTESHEVNGDHENLNVSFQSHSSSSSLDPLSASISRWSRHQWTDDEIEVLLEVWAEHCLRDRKEQKGKRGLGLPITAVMKSFEERGFRKNYSLIKRKMEHIEKEAVNYRSQKRYKLRDLQKFAPLLEKINF